MNKHFDGKYVIVENPHWIERNGQRAQVVASRNRAMLDGMGGDDDRSGALLTLRFSDGRHEDMIAAVVRMAEDQITPVWPTPINTTPAA